MGLSKNAKAAWFTKLENLLEKYSAVLLVAVDNVSSNQMHQIRSALRGQAEVLMGKNTMVRKSLRDAIAQGNHPEYDRLLPHVRGNVGFVFTNHDLKSVRDIVLANRVAAPARQGAVAPNDVFVPPGNTGMEPGKTSFFQALGIPTKIARGTIEITNQVHLIKANSKVGSSEATLLNLLGISPFTYGMVVMQVFQHGNVFAPSILDISDDVLLDRFTSSIQTVSAISLAINYPTLASVTHSLLNAYKDLLFVALATDIQFELATKLKEMLSNPELFAAAAAAAAVAATATTTAGSDKAENSKADAPAAAAKEEAAEESDDDMGFGLFD